MAAEIVATSSGSIWEIPSSQARPSAVISRAVRIRPNGVGAGNGRSIRRPSSMTTLPSAELYIMAFRLIS